MYSIIVAIEIVIPVLCGVFVLYVLARPALAAFKRRRNARAEHGVAAEVFDHQVQAEDGLKPARILTLPSPSFQQRSIPDSRIA